MRYLRRYFASIIFGAANIFPFPGPMSEYNILLLDIKNVIKLKTVLKGLIIFEKCKLESKYIFFHFRDKFSSFVDQRLMIPIATSKNIVIP